MKRITVILFVLISSINFAASKIVPLQIIYTSDEHGWMLSDGKKTGGAAELYTQWLTEDSIEIKNTLILSGGDNFTGPAISTLSKGKAMNEVMDAMGYFASTLGNHEFDFGDENLVDLINHSKRYYLAANVQFDKLKTKKNFAAYKETAIDGLKVIVVGMTNYDIPSLTKSENIDNTKFLPYIISLDKIRKKINQADIAVFISHICADDLKVLMPDLIEMGFDVIGGGHCHSNICKLEYGIPLLEGNPHLKGYEKVTVNYNTDLHKIENYKLEKIPNKQYEANEKIEKIINKWKKASDKVLNEKIGYLEKSLAANSPKLVNLILSSWINEFPQAQIAFTNKGSIRQGMPEGDITIASIMGILPFENNLVMMEVRGDSLKKLIKEFKPYIYGVNLNENYELEDGGNLQDDELYKVLTIDYLYNKGDNCRISEYSNLIEMTDVNFRIPLINYIKSLDSDSNHPIDKHLDNLKRYRK